MENFNLKELGVQEMTNYEMKECSGGFMFWALFYGFCAGFLMIAAQR